MPIARLRVLLVLIVLWPLDLPAQNLPVSLEVAVTTQGTIELAGALVELVDDTGRLVARQISDADGHATFTGIAPGRYRLEASLEGFQTTRVTVVVESGRTVAAKVDMPVAIVGERVEVVAASPIAQTIAGADAIASNTIEQFGGRDGLPAGLRLLASVVSTPNGVSIKGGRPGQASTQVGSGTLVNPVTGLVNYRFPADAVDSIAVFPNPYAVEYGRFSSGLVVIRTRKAALDQWKTRLGSLEPSLHTKRYQPLHFTGLESFGPWIETGGPLVPNRLFLEQSFQFRYETVDIPSRPEEERRVTKWASTLTRSDLNLSTRHSVTGTFGFFPSQQVNSTLGTFTPPEAAVDLSGWAGRGGATMRSAWSDTLMSEATVQAQTFVTDVTPHGSQPMELFPETTTGNFFNTQRRETSTVQWIQTVSATREGWGGLHVLKGGIDVLHTDYTGLSQSRPVLIRASDGTLTRRIDFLGRTDQSVGSVDLATFVQDRVQATPRLTLEFGLRVDRDGIIRHLVASPRAGAVLRLTESGNSLLRGGYGLFYERVPSIAGAFESFESEQDTRYGADGVTPLGPPVIFTPRAELGSSPPRSAVWDLAYEHRFNRAWSVQTSYLERRGAHELVVQPIVTGGVGEMRLDSSGRSLYRDVEFGARFETMPADFTLTYIRSMARADLNALTNFYDSVMQPVVGTNSYAPADTDAPHRLFGRARYQPTNRWLLTGVLDWRTGFPYSAVDASLDFLGPRNVGHRFPNRFTADLGVERHFLSLKWKPWIGVRLYNAFDSFVPSDVQANVSSPLFGQFYNSDIQQIRLQIRFER